MRRSIGFAVLGLSAAGFPLTQIVIDRWGRRGAIVVEAVCAGLLVRDASMIAAGAPRHLRTTPAVLLWSEIAAAAAAVAAGLPLALGKVPLPSSSSRMTAAEVVRRAAIGVLLGLHTLRFGIYLRRDRGLRPPLAGDQAA